MVLDFKVQKEILRAQEADMNMLDMNSREKVNKIHLDEMHQDAKIRQRLRDAHHESKEKRQEDNVFAVIKAFFAKLSALAPHHAPRRYSSHHVK